VNDGQTETSRIPLTVNTLIDNSSRAIAAEQQQQSSSSRATAAEQQQQSSSSRATAAEQQQQSNSSRATYRAVYCTVTSMKVKYVELNNKDGTRGRLADGSDVDEVIAALNGDDLTVQSLKEFIFPPAGVRNLGRVAIYAPPAAAGFTEWVRKSPNDPLVENALYGYIDSRAQQQQPSPNGKLRCCFRSVFLYSSDLTLWERCNPQH
jgi:hypothetical protein